MPEDDNLRHKYKPLFSNALQERATGLEPATFSFGS
jgi:hypothetical protein